MYLTVLTLHSILRWAVIVAGLVATSRAWRSVSAPAARGARSAGLAFTVLFDAQMLVGLTLYFFLSVVTTSALHHMGAAMSNSVLRFWAVEHPFGMIAALVLAHLGRAKSGRNSPEQSRRAAVYFTLSVVIVIATMPWPFMPYGRPLL